MKDQMEIEKINQNHDIKEILKIDLEAVEYFYELIKDKYTQD